MSVKHGEQPKAMPAEGVAREQGQGRARSACGAGAQHASICDARADENADKPTCTCAHACQQYSNVATEGQVLNQDGEGEGAGQRFRMENIEMASIFHFLAKGHVTQMRRCKPNGAEWRVCGCHQSLPIFNK